MEGGYMGTIVPIAYNFATVDYMYCQGQQLTIQQYAALSSLLGSTFGGNGSTNFNLPNLKGRTIVGVGMAASGGVVNHAWGTFGGNEAPSLTQSQLPAHTHVATFLPTTGSQQVTIPASGTGQTFTASLPLATAAAGAAAPTASSATNYLGAVTAKVGVNSATFVGPFTNSTTAPTGGASSPVTVAATGSPVIPATTVTLTGLVTGGTVTNAAAGASATFSTLSPFLALNFIICVTGLYPARN